MATRTWTDELLDELREVGDPPADGVIAELFAGGEVDSVNALMKTLVRNDGLPPAKLPGSCATTSTRPTTCRRGPTSSASRPASASSASTARAA